MKFFFVLFSFLLVTISFSQTWSWASAPKAGETSEIRLTDIPVAEGQDFLVYYYFEGTKLQAMDAVLASSDWRGSCTAKITIPQSASWIAFALKDKDGELISAYEDVVSNENAKTRSDAVQHGLALAFYTRNVGIEKNDIGANAFFRDAILADASWLNQPDVIRGYYQVAKAMEATSDIEIIKNHLVSLSKNSKNATEAMMLQATRLAQAMGDSTLKVSLRKQTDKLFPKNMLVQEEAMLAFKKATSLDEQIKLYNQYKAKFPVTDDNKIYLTQMASTIVQAYAEKEDWSKVKLYILEIPSKLNQSNVANQFAWQLSGESTDKEGSHYDIAAELSSKSIDLLAQTTRPTFLSPKEWSNNMEISKAQKSDTYALILYKLGKYEEAVNIQRFAVDKFNAEDIDINERYVIYLEKAGHEKELAEFMDQIMLIGKASARVKEIHKTYWTKKASTEELYKAYVKQIEDKAHDLIENKIRKMWKEEEPVAFTLKDLNGKEISLSDYKGKTVVLDFWATWCGPCKASFPGMKKAVEHYASDKDVVFLFVDTWENKENLEPRVSGFIRDNSYPFHVLLDSDNKVVTDYKIGGIPTKYIIGPDQKVRFVSIGFGGSTDELLEEMKIMIEMARAGSIVRS